jgi:hypothetical protein
MDKQAKQVRAGLQNSVGRITEQGRDHAKRAKRAHVALIGKRARQLDADDAMLVYLAIDVLARGARQ